MNKSELLINIVCNNDSLTSYVDGGLPIPVAGSRLVH